MLVVGSEHDGSSALLDYKVRAAVTMLTLVAVAAWWWANKRGAPLGYAAVPVIVGTIAAMALASSVAGTPFAPGGLASDQSFRTAAVTRFADSWQLSDYTMKGLPTYYPPAYFWVLGRAASLLGADPWRLLKVGAVLTALLAPVLTFLLWRRLVPDRVASLLALAALVVHNAYEPYAWLVLVAIVPWWLEVAYGLRRDGLKPAHPLFLGAIGALLILTYWYFFALLVLAWAVHLAFQRASGRVEKGSLRRALVVLAIAGAASAVYWVPLVASVLRADHPQFLVNRWFNAGHGALPLPMLEATLVGAVSLLGLVYLVWAARSDALARGLLTFLIAGYLWYLIGGLAAVHDHPLLSFRGKPLTSMVLVIGGILALVRLAELLPARWHRGDTARVLAAVCFVAGAFVAQTFVTEVRGSELTATARETSPPDVALPAPSAEELQQLVERGVGDHPTLLSVRVDILALYPNYSFIPWNAHYSHPAAEFARRAAFLEELSQQTDPSQFAAMVADNEYGRIDAFVLSVDGPADEFVFEYLADAYPKGTLPTEVRFAASLFAEFDLTEVGGLVVATRR